MKKMIPILIMTLVCNSCARIFNKDYTKIKIHTSEPTVLLFSFDTLETENNQADLRLLRSRKDIEIICQSDTLQKTITLSSKHSPLYFTNIITNFGYGMLFDRMSDRRFSYPKDIYLDMSNDKPEFSFYNKPRRGEWYWKFSIPFANHFNIKTEEELGRQLSTGFWGIGSGFDYYYTSDRFLSANVSYSSNFPYGIPYPYQQVVSLNRGSDFDAFQSFYIGITNNHRFNIFSLGYGLTFGKKSWEFRIEEFTATEGWLRKYQGRRQRVGLLFSAHIQSGKHFNLGLNYHPTFIDYVNEFSRFHYEHLISVECLWRFRIRR